MMGCGHLLSFLEARLGAWFSKKKLKVKVPGWMKVYLRHNLVGSCQLDLVYTKLIKVLGRLGRSMEINRLEIGTIIYFTLYVLIWITF